MIYHQHDQKSVDLAQLETGCMKRNNRVIPISSILFVLKFFKNLIIELIIDLIFKLIRLNYFESVNDEL